ncbi:MAG TPA: YlxR family protein [Firmicutes bacterium]|uniref:YlxR family protein n=1 Tax=Capillibacterium thermochitinicola TaxID=2699427 RepID=A0A8J6LT20_9FIRM|nr:YlxR family protein [Capillibacterium thermochitinicola]MBA2133847.1 YlxR family protein [Capillibacterium thermochitinicola]HHW11642.1 YlxR family protein [Bacillota bacterium]
MATRQRKIPQRTCIGCNTVRAKRELIRIVRTPELEVLVDFTGKKSGRGCYICPSSSCLEKALKGNLLANKLEVEVGPELKEKLKTELMMGIVHDETP